MAAHFLAITARDADIEFGRRVAQTYGLIFHTASKASEVRDVLVTYPQTLVFWDVDHPEAADPTKPTSVVAISQELALNSRAERVVAVSDKALKDSPHLFGVNTFNHHVFRRYDSPSFSIYSKIGVACLKPDPFGLAHYVPESSAVSRIVLKRSGHRAAAVEAVNNVFLKAGGHPRLVSMVAQTADELLMNAIFSAPVDTSGNRYRSALDRKADFELTGREQVSLELASNPEYFGLLVADQFGTLKKEVILPFIQKDYQSKNYVASGKSASAGLGLYSILQSGQSLLFISKPGVRTEVALIFPFAANPKAFKEAFRFFSFIFK